MNKTTTNFPMHTLETAPSAAREGIQAAVKAFGFLPNLQSVMSEAPQTLTGYMALWDLFGKSSFTLLEQQIVYMTANYENECHYCVAGHSTIAKMQKLPPEIIGALREGKPLEDRKLEALRRFVSEMVTTRGWPSEEVKQAFFAAGYGHQQALEVVLGIATKVISNYTNHLAQTPLDAGIQAAAWLPAGTRRTR